MTTQHPSIRALLDALSGCGLQLSYYPMADEINPQTVPALQEIHITRIDFIPKSRSVSPDALAKKLTLQHANDRAFILVPGQKFDRQGTRHGRGFGWYDRLLARLPKQWIRIGLTDEAHLSPAPLVRNDWDEPMDWIVCQNENGWEYHETYARNATNIKK